MAGDKEVNDVIQNGLVFRPARSGSHDSRQTGKVKTKARKKQYITGLHGSAAAKKKARIRQRRANRNKS